MALNQALLESEILKIVRADSASYPRSQVEAAAAWANAYDLYARAAQDASRDVLATANRPGFQSALRFNSISGNPALAATEFGNAFVAYWTGAVFAIGIPPLSPVPCPFIPPTVTTWVTELSSVVSTVTPTTLISALTVEFSTYEDRNPESKARAIAGHFHAATISNVLVLISGLGSPPPPPPGPPAPVTQLCTIS